VEGILIHRESRQESYRRTFELDPSIDASKISAKIDQGVVTLTLPKAEHVKPRKITVSLKSSHFWEITRPRTLSSAAFSFSRQLFRLANCHQRSN
jgi:hypothetical protein